MISQEFSLAGKVALVAGDSEYWSKYAAGALAEAGADVVIAARNTRKLEDAAEAVRGHGSKAITIPTYQIPPT